MKTYEYEGWHGLCYVAGIGLISTTGKGKQTKENEMVGLTTDAKRVHQLNGEKLEAIEWETRKPAVAGRNQREDVSEMGYLAQRELNRRARRRESGEGPCDGEGRIGGTGAAAGRPPCQGM